MRFTHTPAFPPFDDDTILINLPRPFSSAATSFDKPFESKDLMSTTLCPPTDPYLGSDFDLSLQPGDAGSFQEFPSTASHTFSFPQTQAEWNLFPTDNAHAWMSSNSNFSSSRAQSVRNARTHQRAASNSSIASFSDSPHSRASSLQYPTTYNPATQYVGASWESGLGGDNSFHPNLPHQQQQTQNHLPTPSHTPTQATFNMDSRRTTSAQKAASAQAASRAMRSVVQNQPGSRHASPVASNQDTMTQDWPTTPRTLTGDDSEFRPNPPLPAGKIDLDGWMASDEPSFDKVAVPRNVANLDRTYSDMCGDELYNPPQSTSSPSVPSQSVQLKTTYLSPRSNPLSERLQDANKARITPSSEERKPSPFRESSELFVQGRAPMQTAANLRHQNKVQSDAMAYQQHYRPLSNEQPATVSPKDAFGEQSVPEEESMPSLFPPSSNQSGRGERSVYGSDLGNYNNQQQSGNTSFSFAPSSINVTASTDAFQMAARQFSPFNVSRMHANGTPQPFQDLPAHLYSMETTKSESAESNEDDYIASGTLLERPLHTTADRGTYSCTYHGCSQRFATSALLQKHKRDDHRSIGAGSLSGHKQSPGPQAMTQAGPHQCNRINPSTGKPCNTIFSRPYDLTRHEDTIHAERKKVRCPHCTEEKTFSRADALTRHLRVVHPQVRFPGKHSRRRIE